MFQHTTARRRLLPRRKIWTADQAVSTHSRPKAAARRFKQIFDRLDVSTHSHPKAAAFSVSVPTPPGTGFNTQPPEGGCRRDRGAPCSAPWCQHTAARRRLRPTKTHSARPPDVSTHSRPKAAARMHRRAFGGLPVSTHSRPKAAA